MDIIVKVPSSTPAGALVYLAADRGDLGGWKPDGVRLSKLTDGTWGTRISVGPEEVVQFKFTLGDWERVERDSLGHHVANRQVTAGSPDPMLLEVEQWGWPGRANSFVGDLRQLPRFHSVALGNYRTVWVWLPEAYKSQPGARFPVIYMHDGQNLFDVARSAFGVEWGVDDTATRMIAAGEVRPFMVVGIENNADRFGEYTPSRCGGIGGRGKEYARFVAKEVKPMIDATYRTIAGAEGTFVAGSSLGGLISLYILREHSEAFGGCGALSPSLWWSAQRLLLEAEADASWAKGKRVWLDMGTEEKGWGDELVHVESVTRMRDALVRGGANVEMEIEEGGLHDEEAWARRLPRVLKQLLG